MAHVESIKTAVSRAIQFLSDSHEPQALLWLELIHRHFGIAQFADSLKYFDQLLADKPEEAPKLRVLRRIADRSNALRQDDLDSITLLSDEIIVAALYCDRLELPRSFPEVLGKAVRSGGYYCTHALLAWIWVQEYGGRFAAPAGFVDELFAANTAIVNEETSSVTDLKLEAAAFLCLAGQGARVDAAFINSVLGTQNADGGWGKTREEPGRSAWHGTVLGLLLLLHVQAVL